MKLRTGRLTDMRGDDATIHDAAEAHAMKRAEREADALFNASTRWFRARAWINTRASELMREWGFDSGEVE